MALAFATNDVPEKPAERRVWIIAMLRLRGTSLRQIAMAEGVTHQAASNALLAPSQSIEIAIAEGLGLPVWAVFPDRFDAQGNRITQTRPQKRTTRGHAVKRRGAA